MTIGTAQIIRANARHLPLADNTVDLVVTSPPYFALRSYQDGGEHYAGQLGAEPTPAEFVAALLEVTRECARVLKPSGSLWVNLGDKYVSRQSGYDQRDGGSWAKIHGETGDTRENGEKVAHARGEHTRSHYLTEQTGIRAKSLIGIPWRYALACIDDIGLILRAEVIWSKPNGLPESVTDRVRRSHETWFHFTLEPRYFSAVDEIRERHSLERYTPTPTQAGQPNRGTNAAMTGKTLGMLAQNPLGKLPGSVWVIPTEPLTVPDHLGIDHFAAFPTEWPRRIIQGWSPAGVCVECGEGRRPVTDVERTIRSLKRDEKTGSGANGQTPQGGYRGDVSRVVTGYACACPQPAAPTTPGVVLDCFGGTGTTALVAKALGRHGISIDMSADYCRLATWRTNNRNQLAKVLGIAKTPAPDNHQLDLFGDGAA
jgi:DNA modification methylase